VLAGWLLAGIAMSAGLYDPAFATLHQMAGGNYRRTVTALTLFGGFASTVFWPLSQYLLETVGWRGAFAVYAGLHFALCLPIHAWCVPSGLGATRPSEPSLAPVEGPAPLPREREVFAWLATALALVAFISTAIAAHFITLMTASGLSARDAVLIGAMIGPMQVAGRIVEFTFTKHVRARTVGTLAFGLMVVALAIFTQVRGVWILALAFVIPYGWANGVVTIVRGTVPAELFGPRNYGALLGRLALPQFILKALAPFALTLLFAIDPERGFAPYALLLVGVLAFVAYRAAVAAAARP
jgi:predicted MFS family arabinose efflux permease